MSSDYYNKLNDEELYHLLETSNSIPNKLDCNTICRVIKIYPNYSLIYHMLNDTITSNKHDCFELESATLNELKQKTGYPFSQIFGQSFAGINITKNNELNLYFTNGSNITMIKCNFESRKISLNLTNLPNNSND